MAFNPDFKAPHRNFMVDLQSVHEHQPFLDSEIHNFRVQLQSSCSVMERLSRSVDHFSARDTPLPQLVLLVRCLRPK